MGSTWSSISPNDPDAMLRHTAECRQRGYAFAADPSQQLARMDGDEIRQLCEGAAYLFCNDYEHGLLVQKTGWTDAELRTRIGVLGHHLGRQGRARAAGGRPGHRGARRRRAREG